MKRVPWLSLAATGLLASLLLSCQESTTEPVAVSPSNSSAVGALSAVVGNGTGEITIYPTSGVAGYSARVMITVTGASPWTSLRVQRAAEYDRPLCDDGIGQRALELWPWEQPSCSGFAAEPAFEDGCGCVRSPDAVILTDDEGNGCGEFVYYEASIPLGLRFDVVFRVLGQDTVKVLPDTCNTAVSELRSPCFRLQQN